MSGCSGDLYIGIDVGGTNIKAGLADSAGNLCMTDSVRTGGDQGTILSQILDLADQRLSGYRGEGRIKGIGLAVPGSVDRERLIAVDATNLPWRNMEVGRALRERFGLPVRMEKDTDAGALGELLFGKAKGMRNFVYVALGTGVGGGLIIDGRLYLGGGGAGEIGHMVALTDGPVCKCGTKGCLEGIASGPAIVEAAGRHSGRAFTDSMEVFAAAADGDPGACEAVRLAGLALGSALLSVSRLLAPEAFIIGGGVAKAGERLLDAIRDGVRAFSRWGCAEIILTDLADWSGVLGAAAAVSMADYAAIGAVGKVSNA